MAGPPAPVDLRVEDATEPLGIETPRPRLRWRFDDTCKQTAYRVLVASDPDHPGDVWDSGRIETDRMCVRYDGPALDAREQYHWTVRVWNEDDEPSDWSAPGRWEMGLCGDWTADWIGTRFGDDGFGTGDPSPAPYFRHEFAVDGRIERARLYVSGVGYHEVHLNGDRVGERVLDPGATDYEERVLYSTFDVTDRISDENAIAVVCGRARYADPTESVWRWHEAPWHSAAPNLCCQLELRFENGAVRRITSNDDWQVGEGGTRFDSLFEGTVFDARMEPTGWTEPGFDATDWATATAVVGPAGDLTAQQIQPIRIQRTFSPESIEQITQDTYVFDAGEMVAGRAELRVDGPAGVEVRLTHGERRGDDGRVDPRDLWQETTPRNFVGERLQTDTYVLAGDGEETWTPRFTYHGFRYVEVQIRKRDREERDLCLDDISLQIRIRSIHTAVDTTESDFECSEPLLERIHRNSCQSILNNLHSIPTDTPMYEKNGWTGDALVSSEAALYNFDMVRFYRKWLADFADAQLDSGELPVIVPTSDWGYVDGGEFENDTTDPSPVWDAAYVFIPWWCYRYCGDRRILERHYEGMKRLVDYHRACATDHIITTGYGDHLAPELDREHESTPEEPAITSTAYYAGMTSVLSSIAGVLGHENDRVAFANLHAEITTAFNREFFDSSRGVYATGECAEYRQTSNVLPVAFGLVPDGREQAVLETLVANIREKHDGHLDTGVVGTKHLFATLTEHGHADLACEIATQRTYPSYGYWIERGASALYEFWEHHSRSRNHHMYASVDDWFYRHLAGVAPAAPGFETIRVKPHLPTTLDHVSATVETVRGVVSIGWKRTDDGVKLDVGVPANTSAVIHVPGEHAVTESTTGVASFEETRDGRAVYTVGAGDWTFETGN